MVVDVLDRANANLMGSTKAGYYFCISTFMVQWTRR